jgi:hypothetical protein
LDKLTEGLDLSKKYVQDWPAFSWKFLKYQRQRHHRRHFYIYINKFYSFYKM